MNFAHTNNFQIFVLDYLIIIDFYTYILIMLDIIPLPPLSTSHLRPPGSIPSNKSATDRKKVLPLNQNEFKEGREPGNMQLSGRKGGNARRIRGVPK